MSAENDEAGKNLRAIDGFDGVENDGVEDEEGQPSNSRVVQGTRLAFGTDYAWTTGDGEKFPKTRELVVIDTARVVQKWVDNMPGAAIFVEPSQKWPNIAKLNDACPRAEWCEDYNGNPQGPWQRQRAVYFVDLNTMEKFTWPSGTVGADICVTEFRERVRLMRQFRGARVFAVVTLGDTYMHTRHGGRQRPDLKIVRWITLGADGGALPSPSVASGALPSPSAPSPASASAQPDQIAKNPVGTHSGVRTVAEPSLSEQMGGDKVPW